MNKLLTISIAAYNVEKYIKNTLNSLLVSNLDKLEVLIINDGSTDQTANFVNKYIEKYPKVFKIINKKNGGYGSTINTGINYASGKYFKQLDGDDWYNTSNLSQILDMLDKYEEDAIYTPYTIYYENIGKTEISYEVLNKKYENIDDFLKNAKKISMHNLMYKTSLLKENNIVIDENRFYTDTEYVVYPLLYAKTIATISLPLYIYRMGRAEQSISYEGRIRHYKDHIAISNNLVKNISRVKNISTVKKNYLYKYIAEIAATCVGGFLILLRPTKEMYKLILKYDENIKNTNYEIYELMPKYSKSLKIIRKRNYFEYKTLYYYKLMKRRMK